MNVHVMRFSRWIKNFVGKNLVSKCRCMVPKGKLSQRAPRQYSNDSLPVQFRFSVSENFNFCLQWPTPSTYRARPSVGTRQFTNPENPSFSMGYRRGFSISRKGTVPGILSFTLYTYTAHSQYELHHSYRCRKRASSQPIQPTQS